MCVVCVGVCVCVYVCRCVCVRVCVVFVVDFSGVLPSQCKYGAPTSLFSKDLI